MELVSETRDSQRLRSYTYEKEQRLRKLRVMNGSGTHDLVSIRVHLPLAGGTISIQAPG